MHSSSSSAATGGGRAAGVDDAAGGGNLKRKAPVSVEDADAKRKKREERGMIVLDAVAGSYYRDPVALGPIYNVWGGLLTLETLQTCMGTMKRPKDAHERALKLMENVIAEEPNQDAVVFLKARLDMCRDRAEAVPPPPVQSVMCFEVDMLLGEWKRKKSCPDDAEYDDEDPPQTKMIFVCKHTGATLGTTGLSTFAIIGDTAEESIIVKNQKGCIMNSLRGSVAVLMKSPFFDIKKNGNRSLAEASINHAVWTIKEQLATSFDLEYDNAVRAVEAKVKSLCDERKELIIPQAVEERQGEYTLSLARISEHDAKYARFFPQDDADEEEEEDEAIKGVMNRLRETCIEKKNALTQNSISALAALDEAKGLAEAVMSRIAVLDLEIASCDAAFYSRGNTTTATAIKVLKKKDDMSAAEFGGRINILVQKLTTDVVEAKYYSRFRTLLYLFKDVKTIPLVVKHLKKLVDSEVIRVEACMALMIRMNAHFSTVAPAIMDAEDDVHDDD
jgi:hypothetical protein